jgi:hypothetical protein
MVEMRDLQAPHEESEESDESGEPDD